MGLALFLPLCGSQGLNSSPQACDTTTLPASLFFEPGGFYVAQAGLDLTTHTLEDDLEFLIFCRHLPNAAVSATFGSAFPASGD